MGSYPGRSRLGPERATPQGGATSPKGAGQPKAGPDQREGCGKTAQKSAQAIVAADKGRRAKRGEVFETMSMLNARRQKSAQAERAGSAHGEAGRDAVSDEANSPRRDHEHTGSARLQAALTRDSACPDSHDLNFSNRPVRTRMPGGVGGGSVRYPDRPLSRFRSGPISLCGFSLHQSHFVTGPNWRFERDAPTAGFTACFRAPQAKR